jgi:integrase
MRRPAIALRPYIYTRKEIGRLMAAARKLFSPHKLRCQTYYHLIGLLAATDMRSGEAVRLANSDVNLAEGLITIRESKVGKSRVVPLHSTTVKSPVAYKARRDAFLNKVEAPRFFISEIAGQSAVPMKASARSVGRRDLRKPAMEFLPGCMIYVTRSLSRRYSPGTATVQMSSVICRFFQPSSGTATLQTPTAT